MAETVQFGGQVDPRDISDAKRLFVTAFRRRPRADAIDVLMSVSMASIYTIMEGLSQGLPKEKARSLIHQLVDQAAAQIGEPQSDDE